VDHQHEAATQAVAKEPVILREVEDEAVSHEGEGEVSVGEAAVWVQDVVASRARATPSMPSPPTRSPR